MKASKLLRLHKSGFLLFSPISILAVPIAFGANQQYGQVVDKLLFGIFVTALTWLIYSAAIRICKFISNDYEPHFTLFTLIFVGAFRGYLFYECASWFGLMNPSGIYVRVLNSTASTLLWLGLANLIVEVNESYFRKYQARLMQLALSNIGHNKSDKLDHDSLISELSELKENMVRIYSDVKTEEDNPLAFKKASENIKNQINEAIRPMSHRLWQNSIYKAPRHAKLRLIGDSIINLEYSIFWLSISYLLISTINSLATNTLDVSILKGASGTLVLIMAELTRRLIIEKLHKYLGLFNVIFVLAVGVLVTFISSNIFTPQENKQVLGTIILFTPYVSIMIVLASAIQLGISDRKQVLENIEALIQENQRRNLQIASYLHNSLQSQLNLIVGQLENLEGDLDFQKSAEVLQRLEALINRSISEDLEAYQESPKTYLLRAIDSWNSLIKIEFDIDDLIYTDVAKSIVFVQAIEEAIANAARKGAATYISIKGFSVPDGYRVFITDNGKKEQYPGNGLGLTWISKVSKEFIFEKGIDSTQLSILF